jgi:hypothetical protein
MAGGHAEDSGKRERPTILRRMASAVFGAFKPRPEAVDKDAWKADMKRALFRNDTASISALAAGSHEKGAYLASLLWNSDYRLSAGWALGMIAAGGADISFAVPSLEDSLPSDDRNVQCLSARALAHHHLNSGRPGSILILIAPDNPFIRREVFDAIRSRASEGEPEAVGFLVSLLIHEERPLREMAVASLEFAIEMGEGEARSGILESLSAIEDTGPVTRLLAVRNIERIRSHILRKEKESSME